MRKFIGLAAALLLSLAALATWSADARAQALGPEERAYAVETSEGRYTA